MSRVVELRARELCIPFRTSFRHASAERSRTASVWLTVRTARGAEGLGEGCPREYVTRESVASALHYIAQRTPEWTHAIHDLASLRAWVEAHGAEIDAHPAAWCAVELAMLDAFAREAAVSVESLLGIPHARCDVAYTAVLGDAACAAFRTQLDAYRRAGLREYKIKLCGVAARDAAKVRALRAAGIEPSQVRADANNVWPSAAAAIAGLEGLGFAFDAIEEPVRPGDFAGLRAIARACRARIILDESALVARTLDEVRADAPLWKANVRVSKMGGLLRSLGFARAARDAGVRLVLGAHVGETSLLARAALALARAVPELIDAREGAFGMHLLEYDPVQPCIMFGHAGVLDDASVASGPGWGLSRVEMGAGSLITPA